MTLVVLGTFVRALQRAAAAPGTLVRNVRSSPTAVGDPMIGAAVAKETVNSIAGHPVRDTPFAALVVALALTVYAFRAGSKWLLHGVRPSIRRIVAAAHTAGGDASLSDLTSNVPVSRAANSSAVSESRAVSSAAAPGLLAVASREPSNCHNP